MKKETTKKESSNSPFASLKMVDTKVTKLLPQFNINNTEEYLKLSEDEIFGVWQKMRRCNEGICFGSFKYMIASYRNVPYNKVVVKKEWEKRNEELKKELREERKRKRTEGKSSQVKEEKPTKRRNTKSD